jgi:uroporphyrinogen decarboxylase
MNGHRDSAASAGASGVPASASPGPGSRDLLRRVLAGETTSRVPTGPLAVHFCATLTGNSLRRYTTCARLLAESVVRYYERFRPDAVWVSADTWISAQAMGAQVGAVDDDQPFCGLGAPPIRTLRDIERIPPPNPFSQGRYPLMVEALARVVEQLGREVFVVACFDQFPFSLAAAMAGINEFLVKMVDDRPFVLALMERCLEYAVAYARALSDAGADLLSGGDAPAGLVGPRAYREIALPFERRLISQVKTATRKPVSLHICGRATPILADMAATGADVLEVDHLVALSDACRLVRPQVTLWGNLDPVGLLAQSSPQAVREAARQAVATVRACGRKRFVLSSGCTLAIQTPPENLEAMLHYYL